jgi:hypothetical protein
MVNGRVIADVTLVRSNFFTFCAYKYTPPKKLGGKTMSEHRRVIYQSTWKGLL